MRMKAVVFERNKLVNRRIVRIWACAGLDVVAVEDPQDLPEKLQDAEVLGADGFDLDVVLAALRRHPGLRAALWTPEPIDRLLSRAYLEPRVGSIMGRPSFDVPPRDWELMLVGRHLLGSDRAAPMDAFTHWGATGFEAVVRDTQQRDANVARISEFIEKMGAPKRVAELFSALGHELLMNAMYDAPVDEDGRLRHAHDRKAAIVLPEADAPHLHLACDGARLVLKVRDRFGRLERNHVFGGLVRGLSKDRRTEQMDRSHGGAGLGMLVCHTSTVAMVFEVQEGRLTQVTGVYDLDLNLREFRTQAKSVHFFEV